MSLHDIIQKLTWLIFSLIVTSVSLSNNPDTIHFDSLNWNGTPKLGLNYVLFFTNDNANIYHEGQTQPTQFYPIYRISKEDPLGDLSLHVFELSYYNVLGAFVQLGMVQANLLKAYPVESQARYRVLNHIQVAQAKQSIVNSGGASYDLLPYQYAFSKRPQTYSFGLYYSPWKFLYVKLGVSSLKAEQFQIFIDEEDLYRSHLQDYIFEFSEENIEGKDTYVLNPRTINKTNYLGGIGFMYGQFQMEIGYNALWRSGFLSVGVNIDYDKLNTP